MASTTIEHVLRVVDQASGTFRSASNAARETYSVFEEADKSALSFGQSLDKAGQGSAKMRGALSTLSPELGNFAGLANDAFDAVEVLSGGMGAINPITVGVTAAIAAGGIAWISWTREAAQAEAQAKLVIATFKTLDGLARSLEDSQLALAVVNGQITQAQADQIAVQNEGKRAIEDLAEGQRDQRAAAEEALSANERLGGMLKSVTDLEIIGVSALTLLADTAGGFSSKTEDARQTLATLDHELEAGRSIILENAAAVEELVVAEEKDRVAKEAKTAATQADTAASKAAALAEKERAKAIADIRAGIAAQASAEAGLASIMSQVETAEQKANRAYRERAKVIEAAADAGLDYRDVLDAISASSQILAADLKAAGDAGRFTPGGVTPKDPSQFAGDAASFAGGAASVAAGPEAVLNTVAMNTGPVGAIVGAIVDIIANLPELLPQFSEWHMQIMDSIGSFPTILMDHLKDTLGESTSKAITALLIELPFSIIDSLFMFFSPSFWSDIFKQFGETFSDAWNEIFNPTVEGDIQTAGLQKIDESKTQTIQLGAKRHDAGTTFVDRTGMAMLHKNEEVITSNGVTTSRQATRLGRNATGRLAAQGGQFVVTIDENELFDALNQTMDRGFALGGTR